MDLYNDEINNLICELNTRSLDIWNQSQKYRERGTFMLFFHSVTEFLSRKDWPLVFIPETYVYNLGLEQNQYDIYNKYQREKQFAILLSIRLDKECTKKGQNDGIHKFIILGKENYLYSKQNNESKIKIITNVDSTERGDLCDYCFLKPLKRSKCSICLSVIYCNKGCQKEGWKKHKLMCELLKNKYQKAKNHLNLSNN